MAAFFDVDLEQVAQIVQRGRGQAEMALLFDRRGLGVALSDDDAPEIRAMFARHVLPDVGAEMIAKVDLAILFLWIEKYSPPIVGHFHVPKLRPPLRIDADGRAQVDIEIERPLGAHVFPPVDELGLPVLECPLQGLVARQVDIVGNLVVVIDAHGVPVGTESGCDQTRSQLNLALLPVPNTFRAPWSPTALGRMKIQFCQAERRAKIRDSMVSQTPKRRFASMPVSASGDMLARSSRTIRISSCQSI